MESIHISLQEISDMVTYIDARKKKAIEFDIKNALQGIYFQVVYTKEDLEKLGTKKTQLEKLRAEDARLLKVKKDAEKAKKKAAKKKANNINIKHFLIINLKFLFRLFMFENRLD